MFNITLNGDFRQIFFFICCTWDFIHRHDISAGQLKLSSKSERKLVSSNPTRAANELGFDSA